MCKQHIPIVVYDCGGTQKYCEKCGKPLEEWKPNNKIYTNLFEVKDKFIPNMTLEELEKSK